MATKMKSAYQKIILSALLLHIGILVSAQTSIEENTIVRSSLDEMFENLDKTKIPTGLLIDYAVDLVELSKYDGTELSDSNYVNLHIFEDILRSVKSAIVNNGGFKDINNTMTSFVAPMTDNSVNLGLVFHRYNYIKANALDDNLIVYDSVNEKVYDSYIDGVWQNPYGESYIFAFTPSSNTCRSGNVTFKFSSAYLFGHPGFTQLHFDAGDGNGYRSTNPMSSVSVNYTTTGIKELKLRLTTPNGQVLESHSTIHVIDTNVEPSISAAPIPPVDTIIRHTTYNGVNVSAQMSYYSTLYDGKIRKPFIVVEGFDPWILEHLTGEFPDDEVNLGYTNHTLFAEKFYDNSTLGLDYDLIFIDWNNSTEDIRANAKLLMMLIEEINEMKSEAGSTQTNVILGQSMGGLIARYALRTMENNGTPHEVTTYISHDSPHLGANVPLGAQYLIAQTLSMIHGHSGLVNLANLVTGNILTIAEQRFCSVLHSMAARQMLVNYVDLTGFVDNTVHDDWQEELDDLGFPEGDFGSDIENLTIVNGRAYDLSSSLIYNKHFLYLDGYVKSGILVDCLAPFLSLAFGHLPMALTYAFDISYLKDVFRWLGSSVLNIHAEVNPLSTANAGQKLSELKLWYTKKFLWLFPKTYNIFSSTQYVPGTGLYYDDYPGSTYTIDWNDLVGLEDDDGVGPYIDTIGTSLTGVGSYQYTLGITDKIMFIPTASALAITGNVTASDFMTDYYSNPPVPITETAFDSYYLYPYASSHIAPLTTSNFNWNWIENHLYSKITGPDCVTGTANFSMSGISNGLIWSTSDSSIATIDNSGKLTTHGNGIVAVTAVKPYANGQLFRKSKDVVVGFPDIVIKTSYATGDGYVFTAESTSSNATQLLAQMVSAGNFQYEWSLLDNNGDRTTQTSSNNSFEYLPKGNETITVAVRLVSAAGNKGPVKSVSANLRVPFTTNYEYVIVTGDGTAYFIKSNGTYEVGVPSQDFTVTYNYTTYDQNDNALTTSKLVEKYLKGTDCYIAYPRYAWSDNYLTGTKAAYQYKWTFTLFDMAMFLDPLESAIDDAGGMERVMYEFDLDICNSLKEKMQKIPFVIIYKPTFPEN